MILISKSESQKRKMFGSPINILRYYEISLEISWIEVMRMPETQNKLRSPNGSFLGLIKDELFEFRRKRYKLT